MKQKIVNLLIVMLCLFSTTSCIAQGKVFKEVSRLDGVTAVYISKSMLRMANVNSALEDVGEGVLKLDGLEVVTCDNAKNRERVQQLIDEEVKESDAELWMAVQKPDEVMTIYAIPEGGEDSTIANKLYIFHSGDNELQCVIMSGKFDLSKINGDND